MDKREFWNRYLRAYDVLNRLGDYRNSLLQLIDRLRLRAGEVVLDAGSGTGNLSLLMAERGARVTSLDFSDTAIAIHREKDPAATVVQASLESRLSWPEGTFDVVTCTSVLFALSREGAARALREMARVLRPGGRILITVMKPGQSKMGMLWSHIKRRWRALALGAFLREFASTVVPLAKVLYYNYRMYGLTSQDGYHRYTKEELLASVRDAGFADIEYSVTYGGHFHMVVARTPEAVPSAALRDRDPETVTCDLALKRAI